MADANRKSPGERELEEADRRVIGVNAAIGGQDGYGRKIAGNFRRNYSLGITQGILYFAASGLYGYGTFFTNLVYELSRSYQVVGLLGAIMNLGIVVSHLGGMNVFEPLREKKRTLLSYGLAFRLTWLLIALTILRLQPGPALVVVLALYTVGQVCNGFYILGFFDLMAKIVPLNERGAYFGLRNALGTGTQALAGVLAGLIIGRYSYGGGEEYLSPFGYAVCFSLAFLLHCLDLALLARTVEEPSPAAGRRISLITRLREIPHYLREDPNFTRYCLLRPLIQMNYVIFPFIIVFIRQRAAMSAGSGLGLLNALDMLSLALGLYVFGRLANRYGFIRILVTCAVLRAVSLFVSLYLHSYVAFLVFMAAGGFLDGGFVLSTDNLLMEFGTPKNRPTYIAVSTVLSGLAGMILPLVAGALIDRFSYGPVFFAAGMIIFVAAVSLAGQVTDPRQVAEYF